MRAAKILLFLLVLGAFMLCQAVDNAAEAKIPFIVETEYGPVMGSVSFSGLRAFKGIPYAAPPTGDLRWRAPQEPVSWKLPLLCDAFKSSCPSNPSLIDMDLQIETFDEDCLYLNIWTPAESADSKLPVMVFIHGGSFLSGSAAKRVYDGTYLAERGVVVVTINYRVGALGFFCHPELADSKTGGSYGNFGLLDQVASLRWVQRNISNFGGDPSRVTIFGESAGAVSVLALISSKLSRGLFNSAIAQSGAIPFGLKSKEDACSFWAKQADKAGFGDLTYSLEALRALDWQKVVKMNPSNDAEMPARSTLDLLCIDGLLFERQPLEVFESGEQNPVTLIVGSNSDELGLGVSGSTQTNGEYLSKLEKHFPSSASVIAAKYPYEEEKPGRAIASAMGDAVFSYSARRAAILHAVAGNTAYHYVFGYAGKLLKSAGIGAFHASDLLYIFGVVDTPAFPWDERNMARIMADLWTSFAKTGSPNREGVPEWPAVSDDSSPGMYLDIVPAVKESLGRDVYDFWLWILGRGAFYGGQ